MKSVLLALFLFSHALVAAPLHKYVSDGANVLSTGERLVLENRLRALSSEQQTEVSVVTVETLGTATIESRAAELFSDWGRDGGALLLIAVQDREVHIETDLKSRPYVTQQVAGQIIREIMGPLMRRDAYGSGINAGVNAIVDRLQGDPAEPALVTSDYDPGALGALAVFLAALLAVLLKKWNWVIPLTVPVGIGASLFVGSFVVLAVALFLSVWVYVIGLQGRSRFHRARARLRRRRGES